nr:MAG TPA: hypothetical protein [Caudoviricetes sp.]
MSFRKRQVKNTCLFYCPILAHKLTMADRFF